MSSWDSAMKEIGGYFGLEELPNHEYHQGALAVNSGRNALVYLIRARKIRKLYIPFYLCDSVSCVCEREYCPCEQYRISADFRPLFKKRLAEDEWLYIVNYFGQMENELEFKQWYRNIIIDNVQAFFRKPASHVDTIYSCRKFFGVPDGGYVYSDAYLDGLVTDVSKDRMTHVLGRYEGVASEYYQMFIHNDESFYDMELKLMSRLTHNILGAIDYGQVKKRRESNFGYLHQMLGVYNKLSIQCPEGPYAYPFYCKDGMVLKRKLAIEKIYIPTLWPDAVQYGGLEKDYSENILPLPCDQRYDIEDMKYMLNKIFKYIEKK